MLRERSLFLPFRVVHHDLSRPVMLMLFLLPMMVGAAEKVYSLGSKSERKSVGTFGERFSLIKIYRKKNRLIGFCQQCQTYMCYLEL